MAIIEDIKRSVILKIHNVRLGFATNSSSTHSIIYSGEGVYDEDTEDGEFGWGDFTVASAGAKAKYLGATLYTNLARQVSRDIAISVVKDWLGVELTKNAYGGVSEYVDHQSLFTLPLTYDRKGVNKEFVDDFNAYLSNNNIAIIGGNDNDEDTHHLRHNKHIDLPIPLEDHDYVARKDASGYWSLFNFSTGTKIRFSFDNLDEVPAKSEAPELVDLKITDYCTMGCKFCYQDSTELGTHAKYDSITSILYSLSNNEVYECAIGGGEPTSHPKFNEIIDYAHYLHIVPNFTTKTLEWLKQPWAKDVLSKIGGFAYSVTSHKQIAKYVAIMKKYDYKKRLYIHYVLGSTTLSEYRKILEECYKHGVQVTLLGYKTNGRGNSFTVYPHSKWLEVIKDLISKGVYIRVGIDTAVVQQFERTIALAGIPTHLYHINEGKFSCYIDAVNGKIAPSSYADESMFTEYKHGEWIETYATY